MNLSLSINQYSMGTVIKQKTEQKRRLTAVNFLKNISLDGQKKRIQLDQQQNVCLVKPQASTEKSSQLLSNGHAFGLKEDYVSQTTIQETFRQPLAPIDAVNENKLNQAKQTSATASATNVKVCLNQNGFRNRAGSLTGVDPKLADSKLANGSAVLHHSNGKVPSFSNTAKQTQSKVRFIKTLKGEKIKGEPIVFSSNRKSPLSIFSSIPFNKQQQFVFTFRDSLKEHGKRRHTSSSRQLSTILDGPEPPNLFEMMGLDRPTEGRDISFQHLLGSTNVNSTILNNNSATFLNQNQPISRTTSHLTNKKKPLLTQHSVIDYSSADCASPNCQKPHQTNVLNQILNSNSISSNHQHSSFHQSFHHHSVHTQQQQPANAHLAASRCVSLEQTQKSTDQVDCFMYEQQLSNEYYKSIIQPVVYDPSLLDDPELIAGKHSTLLVFPSFVTSIIDYVQPSVLKKELNEKFKERFPSIQLSLSKLRSIKKEMCKIAKNECNLDYLTIAQAYVYFEKLILKLLINKDNRKLCAGACLVLSAKLNDVKGETLKKFIEEIQDGFRVSRKDLMATEFAVLIALEFSLHSPIAEVLPHYQRLIYEN